MVNSRDVAHKFNYRLIEISHSLILKVPGPKVKRGIRSVARTTNGVHGSVNMGVVSPGGNLSLWGLAFPPVVYPFRRTT